jgi:PIN domain nuclease of toxin-antitoxin system
LDTHVWLWFTADPDRIADAVLKTLADPTVPVFLSAASTWEIAIKHGLGRLQLPDDPSVYVPEQMRKQGISGLSIEHSHTLSVAALPLHHRDPFDRLLVAQALITGMTIVTADKQLAAYDVALLEAA